MLPGFAWLRDTSLAIFDKFCGISNGFIEIDGTFPAPGSSVPVTSWFPPRYQLTMSDYDEYFDTIDEGILAQVDELDAAGTTAQSSNISRPAVPTRESSKSVSIATNGEEDTALHDLTLDMSDMDELEEAAAQQLRSRAGPGPSAQRAYMQTKLQGGKLPPQSPQRQPQRRPPFGQKSKKTKVWDQTAFAKTGWKSTKTSKSKKGKGRAGDDENDEECVDLDDVPAPYMPRRSC